MKLHDIPAAEIFAALATHPDLQNDPKKAFSAQVAAVTLETAALWSIAPETILGKSRALFLAEPRAAAMDTLFRLGHTNQEVARAFGCGHHSTVVKARERVRQIAAEKPPFADLLHRLRDAFAIAARER